ncbi:hypothetical protein GF325_15245, partial [Candidatus Bathyarchaeota archaeon]|nr:hypothetical protein [Candidatus Bathyarchaeota archaeon]
MDGEGGKDEGIHHLEKSIHILREIRHEFPGTSEVLLLECIEELGILFLQSGKYDEALGNFTDGMKISKFLLENKKNRVHPIMGRIRLWTSKIHEKKGRLMSSKQEINEAIKTFRILIERGGMEHQGSLALALSQRGKLHAREKNCNNAEISYKEALAILKEIELDEQGSYEFNIVVILQALADLHQEMGHLDLAREELSESATRLKKLNET